MYEIVDDYLLDRLPLASLSPDEKEKLAAAQEALKQSGRPIMYGFRQLRDGSWQISIPMGIRRILLGYDIDDKKQLVTLNYVKWDKFREAIDWTVGLLGNEPGGKK